MSNHEAAERRRRDAAPSAAPGCAKAAPTPSARRPRRAQTTDARRRERGTATGRDENSVPAAAAAPGKSAADDDDRAAAQLLVLRRFQTPSDLSTPRRSPLSGSDADLNSAADSDVITITSAMTTPHTSSRGYAWSAVSDDEMEPDDAPGGSALLMLAEAIGT